MKKEKLIRKTAAASVVLTAVLLLLFANKVRDGVLQSLSLSVTTVIPGLFPFLVLSETAALSGLLTPHGKYTQMVMKQFFGLSPSCLPAVLFGLSGGFLSGIKTAVSLYTNGAITKKEAQRLCAFCFSPGPAFSISAVGCGMIANRQAGVLLFFACTLAAMLMGICTKKRSADLLSVSAVAHEKLSVSFTMAVQKSAAACLSLSAWMAVFAALQAMLFALLPAHIRIYFSLFAEVTSASVQAVRNADLPLCAAVLSFGGLCIFCQLLPDLQQLDFSPFVFLRNRIVHAILAYIVCKAGLFFFPSADMHIPVMQTKAYSKNPASAFFLLLACFIFILDLAPRKKTWYTQKRQVINLKQKIFGANIEKNCACCEFGKTAPDGDMILCIKKGLRAPDSKCMAFRYDPFKRRPPAAALPVTEELTAADFSLDV